MNLSSHNALYKIGCPVWACPHWRGTVFGPKAAKEKWLRQYSQVFSTVEGNSTFYGIPAPSTFQRWAEQTVDGFQFCLKFPRVVSHEKALVGCEFELDQFLKGVEILAEGNRLGPTFLQLGPSFGPDKLDRLADFLDKLPKEFPFAVEVRHLDWFREPFESALDQMLSQSGIDRVIFDSRPLFSLPPQDEIETTSQQRKPRVPVRQTTTATSPLLRLVGRNDVTQVTPWIEEWVPVIADWIRAGKTPYVFTHAPDDRFAPDFGRRFHNRLAKELCERDENEGLAPLDEWPHEQPQQRELF